MYPSCPWHTPKTVQYQGGLLAAWDVRAPALSEGLSDGGRRSPPVSEDTRSRRCWWCDVPRVLQGFSARIQRPNMTCALVARPIFCKRALVPASDRWRPSIDSGAVLNSQVLQRNVPSCSKRTHPLATMAQAIAPRLNKCLADAKGWHNVLIEFEQTTLFRNESVIILMPTETIYRLYFWLALSQKVEILSA